MFRIVKIRQTRKISDEEPFSAGIPVLISSAQPQRYNETVAPGTSQLHSHQPLLIALLISVCFHAASERVYLFFLCFLFFESLDDEFERGYYASVSTGSTQDPAPHSLTLLRLQSNLGLDYSLFNFLYCYYGE